MSILRRRSRFLAAVFIAIAEAAWPQYGTTASTPAFSTAQIVEQMQRHDQARNRELLRYHSLRHYAVEYRGFSADVEAKMDVEVNYDVASGKSFQIVSQSGSGFLIDKVLMHAVESEKEASRNKASTALTPANYRFDLIGNEIVGDRPEYILHVEPLHASKFLYRGKIWVDAADFAVVKMEAQPSKSPSFWISRTLIQCKYAKTDDFWLPQKLRSETSVASADMRYSPSTTESTRSSRTRQRTDNRKVALAGRGLWPRSRSTLGPVAPASTPPAVLPLQYGVPSRAGAYRSVRVPVFRLESGAEGVHTRMSQLPESTSSTLAVSPASVRGEAVEPAPPPMPQLVPHPPQRIPRWLERIELLLRVMLRMYIGLAICYAPWSPTFWDRNPLFLQFPVLSSFALNGAVRGVVSGLGLLNLWIALQDVLGRREG